MSTQTRNQQNETATTYEIDITRNAAFLTYIGQDTNGDHHHYDQDNDRIIVCDDDAETHKSEGGTLVLRTLRTNDVTHIQENVSDSKTLRRWTEFVSSKDTLDWEFLELNIYSINDVLGGGN